MARQDWSPNKSREPSTPLVQARCPLVASQSYADFVQSAALSSGMKALLLGDLPRHFDWDRDRFYDAVEDWSHYPELATTPLCPVSYCMGMGSLLDAEGRFHSFDREGGLYGDAIDEEAFFRSEVVEGTLHPWDEDEQLDRWRAPDSIEDETLRDLILQLAGLNLPYLHRLDA